jgi:hypothetical protein
LAGFQGFSSAVSRFWLSFWLLKSPFGRSPGGRLALCLVEIM